MIKHLTHILKGATSLLAVLMLLLNFQSNLYFKHIHQLSDGSVIEHTHPFSDDNGGQHKHSKSEISFLSLLNPHTDLVQGFTDLIVKSIDKTIVSTHIWEEIIQLMKYPLITLRGPPSC